MYKGDIMNFIAAGPLQIRNVWYFLVEIFQVETLKKVKFY